MLPYCTDAQLLAELSVVLSVGWELPSRPHRAPEVRHLLLLAQAQEPLTYGAAAQRFLHMLDAAIRQGLEAELITVDDEHGLRTLFGTHPNYRTEPSPTVRREQAADFLVPGWAVQRPKQFIATFQRRHQSRALRQALDCLRAAYGQRAAVDDWDYDVVAIDRTYVVNDQRQLRLKRTLETIRPRHDEFEEFGTTHAEHGNDEVEFSYKSLRDTAALLSVGKDPLNSDFQSVRFRLHRPYAAGELIEVAYEQETRYLGAVTQWPSYYVATQTSNDSYSLAMTVRFEGELPDQVWWYVVEPYVDQRLLNSDPDAMLRVDAHNSVRHVWLNAERRMDYGLKWTWPD